MNSGKNSKALCLGATIFLGLALGCAPTLAGKLTDQSGEFIASPDARVNITSLKNPEQGSIVVKADGGSWSTDSDLEPGDYLVEALVPGYGLVSKRITLGETDELSLVLSRLEKAAPSAIGANMHGEVGRGSGGATLTPPKL
jgi:hypothetical protein